MISRTRVAAGGEQDRDVLDHDFPSWAIGRAIPYGIYDLTFDDGLVVVWTSHETPPFAVAAIRRWRSVVGAASARSGC